MAGRAGLKAGLIGIGVVVALALFGRFVPLHVALMGLSTAVGLLAYAGIGALAGWFLATPRAPDRGAGAGAITGLISGLVAGVVGIALGFGQITSGATCPVCLRSRRPNCGRSPSPEPHWPSSWHPAPCASRSSDRRFRPSAGRFSRRLCQTSALSCILR